MPQIPEPATTIADLDERGLRLGIMCLDCGRFRYVGTRKYAGDALISELRLERTCTRCRSGNIEFRPVHRDAATGFWPAEQG